MCCRSCRTPAMLAQVEQAGNIAGDYMRTCVHTRDSTVERHLSLCSAQLDPHARLIFVSHTHSIISHSARGAAMTSFASPCWLASRPIILILIFIGITVQPHAAMVLARIRLGLCQAVDHILGQLHLQHSLVSQDKRGRAPCTMTLQQSGRADSLCTLQCKVSHAVFEGHLAKPSSNTYREASRIRQLSHLRLTNAKQDAHALLCAPHACTACMPHLCRRWQAQACQTLYEQLRIHTLRC